MRSLLGNAKKIVHDPGPKGESGEGDAALVMMFFVIAAAILITINGVLRFVTFGILGVQPVVFWCDNEICITVAKDASSMKHVAYVARRVRFLQEMQSSDHRIISMRKVSGLANPADMLTKHLKKESFKLYAAKLYGCSPTDL